ncbi:DUF3611 family protein [Baaleninema sp.]|uniref:DUF3611 family protein n=1 Tax=Baaleninema sp. TaxID=3101197 RepID=UPI003D0101EF
MSSTTSPQPEHRLALSQTVRDKAKTLRITGWISFWLQLFATFAIVLSLIFAVTGRGVADESNPGIGMGMFLATLGGVGAAFCVVLSFRFARVGKRLLDPRVDRNPKKSNTVRWLKIGAIVGVVGAIVTLLGAGITASVLVAKTISQPPGTTLTQASHAVRALDALVMVANLNGIAAHFIGTLEAIWLFYRIGNPDDLGLT